MLRSSLLAALLMVGISTTLAAQQPTSEQRAAVRAACRDDFVANCSGVQPGTREALACLASNEAKLSPACGAAVGAITGKSAAPSQAAPAATNAPATAPGAPSSPAPQEPRCHRRGRRLRRRRRPAGARTHARPAERSPPSLHAERHARALFVDQARQPRNPALPAGKCRRVVAVVPRGGRFCPGRASVAGQCRRNRPKTRSPPICACRASPAQITRCQTARRRSAPVGRACKRSATAQSRAGQRRPCRVPI